MKVECPSCNKVYNFPDDRLRSYEGKSFKCPACKGTVKLDFFSAENLGDNDTHDSSESTGILQAEDLKGEIVKAIKDLDPMPQVVQKTREVMSKPSATFKEIGKVIETDQAMVAKVLKIANSAYYGLRGKVSSIHQALVVLGHDTLEQVINTAGASKLFGKTMKGYGLQPGVLWNHSLAVAFGAKIIAVKRKPILENDAFVAGLLHDVGKLILDEYILKNKPIFEKLKKENNSLRKAEEKLFGFDHSEIASLLCKEWHLPETQTLAIKYHHDPSSSKDVELAYFLYLADHMARKCGLGTESTEQIEAIEDNVLETLNFAEEDFPPMMDEITEYVGNISKSVF